MIILKKVAFGSAEEAFIENSLQPNCNIIYSHDNNKGKTIVTQSIGYVLGNEPAFPSGFSYKHLYFYLELETNQSILKICRKNNSFIIKRGNHFHLYDSISEFKRFFSQYIYSLPLIIKEGDNTLKLVDPVLFTQLFFVGQDGRNASSIFNDSYYTKKDFINMVYAWSKCYTLDQNTNPDEIKHEIEELKKEKNYLIKKTHILSELSNSIAYASYIKNQEQIDAKIQKLEEKNAELNSFKKKINRLYSSKIKNENLLNELRSLNAELKEGRLTCLDCGSSCIGYENAHQNVTFDVSDTTIRANIQKAIQERIDSAKEDIQQFSKKMSDLQNEIRNLMQEEDVSIESLLLVKKELLSVADAEEEVQQIDQKILNLSNKLHNLLEQINIIKNSKEEIKKQLLFFMNEFYKEVDPFGKLNFDSLFARKDQTFSGSENAEFYLAKLYALVKTLKHPFPIIVDGFREGELSTQKEAIVLSKFSALPNQVIFTTTLKKQESNKYIPIQNINAINYDTNSPSHILSNIYLEDFRNILKEINIVLK